MFESKEEVSKAIMNLKIFEGMDENNPDAFAMLYAYKLDTNNMNIIKSLSCSLIYYRGDLVYTVSSNMSSVVW